MSSSFPSVPPNIIRELEYQLSTSPADRVASRVSSYILNPELFVYPRDKFADDTPHSIPLECREYINKESSTSSLKDGIDLALSQLTSLLTNTSTTQNEDTTVTKNEKNLTSVLFPTATISSHLQPLLTNYNPSLTDVLTTIPPLFTDNNGDITSITFPLSLPVLASACLVYHCEPYILQWILQHADLSLLDFSLCKLSPNHNSFQHLTMSEKYTTLDFTQIKNEIYKIVNQDTGVYNENITDVDGVQLKRDAGVVSKQQLDTIVSL